MKKFLSWLFWPRTKLNISKLPLLFISLNNLFPIFGVLFFDWEFFPILLFYCIEGVITGTIKAISMDDSSKKHPKKLFELFPPWAGISFLVVVAGLTIYFPMAFGIIIAISRINHAFESVLNPYFIISSLILCFNIIFLSIQENKKSKRNRVVNKDKLEPVIFIFKMYALVFLTLWIVYNNFYTPSLIIIAVVKTYIEIRSVFRLQPKNQAPIKV